MQHRMMRTAGQPFISACSPQHLGQRPLERKVFLLFNAVHHSPLTEAIQWSQCLALNVVGERLTCCCRAFERPFQTAVCG